MLHPETVWETVSLSEIPNPTVSQRCYSSCSALSWEDISLSAIQYFNSYPPFYTRKYDRATMGCKLCLQSIATYSIWLQCYSQSPQNIPSFTKKCERVSTSVGATSVFFIHRLFKKLSTGANSKNCYNQIMKLLSRAKLARRLVLSCVAILAFFIPHRCLRSSLCF